MPNNTKTTSAALFNTEQTNEIFSKVNGFSALANLSAQRPIPFAGTDTFVFSMDGEAAIVGEGANKPAGNAAFNKVTIKPLKFVYQHRLTDEFMNMANESRIPYLNAFVDGFAKKMARALDIAAMHGIDPATKAAATATIGNNCLDKAITTEVAATNSAAADLQDVIDAVITADGDVTGIIMSKGFASDMGKMKAGKDLNTSLFPEFAYGGKPTSFNGIDLGITSVVSYNDSTTAGAKNPKVYAGDFANAFRWGYAQSVKTEIIEYGDPDGQGDLKRSNEIVLRAEAYIGWGILNPAAFAKVTTTVAAS